MFSIIILNIIYIAYERRELVFTINLRGVTGHLLVGLSSGFSPHTLHKFCTHVVICSSVSVARKYVRSLDLWKVLMANRKG